MYKRRLINVSLFNDSVSAFHGRQRNAFDGSAALGSQKVLENASSLSIVSTRTKLALRGYVSSQGHDLQPCIIVTVVRQEASVSPLNALRLPFNTGNTTTKTRCVFEEKKTTLNYKSSPPAELKLLLRLLSLDAAPGEPADKSGSAPKGERASSIRISSSLCSSFSVALKKSVKWDSGSEKVVHPSVPVMWSCGPPAPGMEGIPATAAILWR